MSYVYSIGGDALNPNPFSYDALSITGNISLGWPLNSQSPIYPACDWLDITASSSGYIITMPPATEAGIGTEVVFNNYGSNSFIVNDYGASSITTVASGETKRIWITTNSTTAGTWRVANIGSGTTTADASALAGYGLTALAGQLSTAYPSLIYNTSQTLNAGSRGYAVIWSGGSGTFTLASPATLGDNWVVHIKNSGSGTLTIDGGGALVDDSSTISVGLNEGCSISTDGIEFYSFGLLAASASGLTLLNKSVAGSSNVTLTSSEAANNIINLTGAITASINVIVPVTLREWIFYNNTSGAFTVTVKTAAGTGIAIAQTSRQILYCDGTNVNLAINTTSGTVTSVATGTGLTGGPITTTGTILLANTAVVAGTYGAAIGVSSFTVDAQGRLTAASFTARTITGTSNRLTVTNGDGVAGAPTLDISASYVGQTSITTVGTIATGVWSGTAITAAKGGTGATTLTANNVILGNGTSAVQFVAPGSSGNILTSNGTTWVSSAAAATSPVKAYVVFNGTGTPAIISSLNVTSITDNGTGDYTINFTTPLASANYAVSFGVLGSAADAPFGFMNDATAPTSSVCRITTCDDGGVAKDFTRVSVTFVL